MLVQAEGGWGRTQREIQVKELHVFKDTVIAIHHPLNKFDSYVASDLLTGLKLTESTSSKLALIMAEKLIEKYEKQFKAKRIMGLKALFNSGPGCDFKLLERIERKCIARGLSSVKSFEIVSDDMGEIIFK